ncbi:MULTISPECIES: DUF1643 domain-containing protein [unclassified Novosphingobium]|uniref:DUF1643 domain-containing protein n=1 Tax=unclassified Novosphingobium TaxID=2644732 RepID=UPI0006CD99F8|nr:hypothetical protein IP83_03045 [Novosphingobium sp. AAP93]
MYRDAVISPCSRYRYSLTRKWGDGPQVLFVMLNPSTADATTDDRTIGRCISFADSWGFGSLVVGNLFAFRTPSPAELMSADEPVGPENDHWLEKLGEQASLTVAAWGNAGSYLGRAALVSPRLVRPHFLRLTSAGQPSHPLYVSGDTRPTPWEPQ